MRSKREARNNFNAAQRRLGEKMTKVRRLLTGDEATLMLAMFDAPLVGPDFPERLEEDLDIAQRLESEDWHLSDTARAQLVKRAKAIGGYDLGNGDLTSQYINLL